jgi:hypothetical protein
VARLAADHLQHAPVHRERREHQLLHARGLREARDVQEHLVDVVAELGIGGEQPEVGVLERRARVVVAGAEVRVGHDARARRGRLAPQDQRHLRVGLEAEHAVDDLRALALEPAGPVDVRLLVEPRHQLDDDGHLLAAARRLDQRLHQHRVDAGAVDRSA